MKNETTIPMIQVVAKPRIGPVPVVNRITPVIKDVKLEPKISDAYLNRGASYLYLGDTTKALEDYNKAIKLDAFDPEGYIRRSRIYALKHDNKNAIKDLDKAVKLDTANSFALFNRALIRYEEMDIRGALADLDKVLELDPGNALTLYNRALIRTQAGDYNNALDDYDRVIAVNPNNVLAYFNRAGVYLELKQYRNAMDDYSQAINLYPDFAKAYMNRSYAKYNLGQYTSAKRDSEIAKEKIREYNRIQSDSIASSIFADTTKKYDKLLALDADFAKKDFDNELLQHRDIDIRLKPLFRFNIVRDNNTLMALQSEYEDKAMQSFIKSLPVTIKLSDYKDDDVSPDLQRAEMQTGVNSSRDPQTKSRYLFALALIESYGNEFNKALDSYNKAIELDPDNYAISRTYLVTNKYSLVDFRLISNLSGLSWAIYDHIHDLRVAKRCFTKLVAKKKHPFYMYIILQSIANASFSKLFGGDFGTVLVALVAGLIGTSVKTLLTRYFKLDIRLIYILCAFVSSYIALIGVNLKLTQTGEVALAASILYLTPGVFFINSVIDILKNYIQMGISRIISVVVLVTCVGIGVYITLSLGDFRLIK